jgi:hypothetical protein
MQQESEPADLTSVVRIGTQKGVFPCPECIFDARENPKKTLFYLYEKGTFAKGLFTSRIDSRQHWTHPETLPHHKGCVYICKDRLWLVEELAAVTVIHERVQPPILDKNLVRGGLQQINRAQKFGPHIFVAGLFHSCTI